MVGSMIKLRKEYMERTERSIKMEQTYIKKFGSLKAYKEYIRERGSKGGKVGGQKGFAVNKELAREAGRRGGSVQRIRSKNV